MSSGAVASMTVKKSLQMADAVAPNRIGEEIKRRWLGDLEGMIRVELRGDSPEAAAAATPDGMPSEDDVLGAPYPFDRMYWLYLVAMIEYTGGDTTRYANAASMFNAAYASYAKWLVRHGD